MAAGSRPVAWLLPLALWMFAAGAPAGEVTVQILGPVRVRVSNPETLPSRCHTNPDMRLLACTAFGVSRMECRCEHDASQWSLTIDAQLVPILLLGNYYSAEWHERLHVNDVAARVKTYLTRVAELRFDTEEECRMRAESVSNQDSILRHVKAYALQSNNWLQCAKDGERIPPDEAARSEIFPDQELASVQAKE